MFILGDSGHCHVTHFISHNSKPPLTTINRIHCPRACGRHVYGRLMWEPAGSLAIKKSVESLKANLSLWWVIYYWWASFRQTNGCYLNWNHSAAFTSGARWPSLTGQVWSERRTSFKSSRDRKRHLKGTSPSGSFEIGQVTIFAIIMVVIHLNDLFIELSSNLNFPVPRFILW